MKATSPLTLKRLAATTASSTSDAVIFLFMGEVAKAYRSEVLNSYEVVFVDNFCISPLLCVVSCGISNRTTSVFLHYFPLLPLPNLMDSPPFSRSRNRPSHPHAVGSPLWYVVLCYMPHESRFQVPVTVSVPQSPHAPLAVIVQGCQRLFRTSSISDLILASKIVQKQHQDTKNRKTSSNSRHDETKALRRRDSADQARKVPDRHLSSAELDKGP